MCLPSESHLECSCRTTAFVVRRLTRMQFKRRGAASRADLVMTSTGKVGISTRSQAALGRSKTHRNQFEELLELVRKVGFSEK
jgi:hypothetical protein